MQCRQNVRNVSRQRPPGLAESPGDLWERQWDDPHLRTDYARHTLKAFQLYLFEGCLVDQISGLLERIYVAKARVIRWLMEHFDGVLHSLFGVSP
jgi:hypothetical protein